MLITKEYAFTIVARTNIQNQVIGIIERPFLALKIRYPLSHKTSPFNIRCLVDSGSDVNLFPADMANSVGINIRKGEPRRIFGIGGIDIPTFLHRNIELVFENGLRFKTDVQFSESQKIPLLGRDGFFNFFEEVVINAKNSSFKLIYEK